MFGFLSSTTWWANYWYWWLIVVLFSWLPMELLAIVVAHHRGERCIQEWTLSDTIRRWSAAHRWVAPVTVGVIAMLAWHWFAQVNLPV